MQQARTEDLTKEEIIRYKCLDKSENKIIELLKGPGCHLLEGSRGVGKSMLMQLAEIELDSDFNKSSILGIYVNFKSSIVLENDRFSSEYYSFRLWVMAKILQAYTDKLYKLGLIESDNTLEPYNKLFRIKHLESLGKSLDVKITTLQKLALTEDPIERKELELQIGTDFAETFNNVEVITKNIKDISQKIKVTRVVFLFDEAAHAFIQEQQRVFFDMVKLLHGEQISVKIAVYPGITDYGGNFEYGQDAIPITLERNDMYSASARKENVKFFRKLLQKRLDNNSLLAKKVFQRGEVLDLIICLSNGNPRAFLHIMSKFAQNDEFSIRLAILFASDYLESELIKYHKDLTKRLPKYATTIEMGYSLLRNYLIPEIKKKNEGKHPLYKKQSVFFTLEKECPFKIHRALDLLCYSGLISKLGYVKIAARKTAQRYALHLGFTVQDRAFAKKFARKPMDAIHVLSKDDYREFYSTDKTFEEYVKTHKDNMAPCQQCGKERESIEYHGCPYCMTPYRKENILSSLINDPIESLRLPVGLCKFVGEDGRFKKVKDIYLASYEQLETIHMIGQKRSRILRNTAEEYTRVRQSVGTRSASEPCSTRARGTCG